MTTMTADVTRPFKALTARTNDYIVAAIIAVVLTVITYLIAQTAGWVDIGSVSWLEIVAAAINYGATYLAIRQRRAFYLLGVGASVIYAIVFLNVALLGSAVLSLYLSLSLIYGFFRWGKDEITRPVHNLQWKWLPVYLLVTGAAFGGAYLIITLLGGAFAFWDAAILILTILAQFMLDQKVMQTWVVWTLVNIVGVALYFSADLYFAAMQQLLFGAANLYGWMEWRKSLRVVAPVLTSQPEAGRV